MKTLHKILIAIIVILVVLGILAIFYKSALFPEKPVVEPPIVPPPDCFSDIYNCDTFRIQTDAQWVFDFCGGVENDIHGLDNDGNGIACEGLS